MATILDASLVGFLLPVFTFLFIFVVLYGLLLKTEILGTKQIALNFIAAMSIAAVAVFAGNLIKLIGFVTPWIVFIIFVLILIFATFKFFGTTDKDTWDFIGGQTLIYVIILIVIIVGLTTVFEPQISPYSSGENATVSATGTVATTDTNVKGAVLTTLTHPRLLGALFILLVAAFTAKLLIGKIEK